MPAKINSIIQKTPLWVFVASAVLLFVAGGVSWCYALNRPDENKLFWAMMQKSLATSGVTVDSSQDQGTMSVRQVTRYQLGAVNRAHAATVITQPGTTVKSEVVATLKTDYTRYTQINTDSKSAAGKPLDFTKIKGIWAKSQEGGGQLLNQVSFDSVVLHANLSPKQRDKLLNQMRTDNVYEFDASKTKRRTNKETGRTEYVYTVKVQYIPYVRLLKAFAQEIGIRSFDNIDPNSYSGTPPFETMLVVDARSRHLSAVEQADGTRAQKFSGYGVPVQAEIPRKTITEEELKARFANLE